MPLYVTPTRLGHLSERWGGGWAVLPYCARPVELDGAAAAEGEGAVQAEEESGAEDDASVVMARRKLIAFASTASEQERLRRALYASCC